MTPELKLTNLLRMLESSKAEEKIDSLKKLKTFYDETQNSQALTGIYLSQFDNNEKVSQVAENIMSHILKEEGDLIENINQRVRNRVIRIETDYLLDNYVVKGLLTARKQKDRIAVLINIYKNVKINLLNDLETIPHHQTLTQQEKGIFSDTINFYLFDYNQRIQSLKTNSIRRLNSFERTIHIMGILKNDLEDHRTKRFKHLNDIERAERIKTINQLIKTFETLMMGKKSQGHIDKLLSLQRLKKQHQKRLDKRSKYLKKQLTPPEDDVKYLELQREIDEVDARIKKQEDLINKTLQERRKQPLLCRTYKPL